MSDIVIRAENISKQYRLGLVGTGTLSHDLNRFWHKIRGKEDPYLQVGDVNDRTKTAESDYVWALKDINFEVKEGEVLGIIGKNGAGKSTLLKILSRVTQPTMGSIKAKGRIASLLEVGTGFHPELSGRENIFLNGAILGMSKAEIKSKFDEIVDFSGVERYIDTPVKRYSSGMYVRLAFAVAAHLEPEILIVDEVLAVGDAEFQKKCLGKMKDVSGQGRTILFVSHNMGAVRTLCTSGIVLKQGGMVFSGTANDSVDEYLKNSYKDSNETVVKFESNPTLIAQMLKASILDCKNNPCNSFDVFDDITIEVEYILRQDLEGVCICLAVKKEDEILFNSYDTDTNPERFKNRKTGRYNTRVKLQKPMKEGRYEIQLSIGKATIGVIHLLENVFTFYTENRSYDPTFASYSRQAKVAVELKWEVVSV